VTPDCIQHWIVSSGHDQVADYVQLGFTW